MGKNTSKELLPIRELAVSFLKDHWEEIDLHKTEIKESKEQMIRKVKRDDSLAGWVVIEVMSWGTEKDYLLDYTMETDDHSLVLKIDNDLYFKYVGKGHLFKRVQLKYKQVAYFE